jgi:hypothetical protein
MWSQKPPVLNLNATNIFLVLLNLTKKIIRNHKDDQYEEDYKHLQLVLLLLQEVRQSDTNSHRALSVRVAVF